MRTSTKAKLGLVKRMTMVTNTVRAILISVPITFLRRLPGTSLGAFKKAPKTNAGARLKYPKALKVRRGMIKDAVMTTPLKKCELLMRSEERRVGKESRYRWGED